MRRYRTKPPPQHLRGGLSRFSRLSHPLLNTNYALKEAVPTYLMYICTMDLEIPHPYYRQPYSSLRCMHISGLPTNSCVAQGQIKQSRIISRRRHAKKLSIHGFTRGRITQDRVSNVSLWGDACKPCIHSATLSKVRMRNAL